MHLRGILFVVCFVGIAYACNNHELIIHHAKNCGGTNDVVQFTDLKATLGEDCILRPSGCAQAMKPFSTLKVHYMVEKKPMPMIEGDIDACEELKTIGDDIMKYLTIFALPKSCPVSAQKICGDQDKKTVDLTEYKNKFAIVRGSPVEVKLNASHGDAGFTCVDLKFEIKKIKKTA